MLAVVLESGDEKSLALALVLESGDEKSPALAVALEPGDEKSLALAVVLESCGGTEISGLTFKIRLTLVPTGCLTFDDT